MGKIHIDILDVEKELLDPMKGLNFVSEPGNGAETLFVGTIRDLNQGKQVTKVEYDVFEPLAKKSFRQICIEAQNKWGENINLYVVHAKGSLLVGGISIIIAAGSPHREEAFQANRFIIEQIKHRSPIWKLEHYINGKSEWTQGCELCNHVHED